MNFFDSGCNINLKSYGGVASTKILNDKIYMLYLIFGGIVSVIITFIGVIKLYTDRNQKKSERRENEVMVRDAQDTILKNMSGGSLDIKNQKSKGKSKGKSNVKSKEKFNIKLNKYNKWLIIILLLFAMIITHYYKKNRNNIENQQYLQQMKDKQNLQHLQHLQQMKENRSSKEIKQAQPISVFGGQYL